MPAAPSRCSAISTARRASTPRRLPAAASSRARASLRAALLTGRYEHELPTLLDPEWFTARLSGAKFRAWVAALGLEPTFVTDAQAALAGLRARGASDSEQLDRPLEWVRARRVASADQ